MTWGFYFFFSNLLTWTCVWWLKHQHWDPWKFSVTVDVTGGQMGMPSIWFFFWYAVGSIKLVLGGGGKEGTVRKKNILTTPWTRNDRLVIHLFNAAVWIDEPSKTPLIYCTFWAAKELCKGKVIPFLSHKIYFMSCWHWWKDTKRCHTDDSNDVESWDAILEITETFTEIQLR